MLVVTYGNTGNEIYYGGNAGGQQTLFSKHNIAPKEVMTFKILPCTPSAYTVQLINMTSRAGRILWLKLGLLLKAQRLRVTTLT